GDPGPGARALHVGLGPAAQTTNRFAVGPLKADNTVDEKFVVLSGGNVGIGTSTPALKLTVEGDFGRDAGPATLHLWGARIGDVGNGVLFVRAFSGGVVAFDGTNNKVGIGTNAPDRLLTLQGEAGTYLNVKADGGAQEGLLGADGAGGIVSTMTNPDLQLRPRGNVTRAIIKADGNIGIGTNAPARKLHVVGDRLRLENAGKHLDLRADGSAVDVHSETDSLYLRSSGGGGKNQVIINPFASDGKVGIGLEAPACKLHVVDSLNAAAGNVDAHVAVIENLHGGDNADVLAL